nr:substrate-binding domain-containing protein [Viridibacillus soli]
MKKKINVLSIFAAIFTLLGIAFCTFIISILAVLSGKIYYVDFIITVAVVLYVYFLMLLFHFFKTKKRKRVFASIAGIAILVTLVSPIYHMYIDRIPTVAAEVDVYKYQPFSEYKNIPILDEPATLQLTGNLPRMDGATALYPLYAAFVQATYPEKDYSPNESEVMVNTTPDAYSNLFSGDVDMIFVAAPSESQKKTAKQQGLDLKMTPIGREAFVFFVNQKNNIAGLTLEQIKAIYSGEVRNWKELGGVDNPIRAFQRPEDSGSQSALQKLMGDTPIMQAPSEDIASGMGGIINEVAQYKNYKNAIGYTFRYYSTEMVKNDQIKLLEIEGIAPTKEMIRSKKYPITSEFYIVTAGTDNPNVEKLIEWILSKQGQALVEDVGYVPVGKY